MSDFTDDVMDGVFCEMCGTYLGEECGYPRCCKDCKRFQKQSNLSKSICPFCNKKFRTDEAMQQHRRDARHDKTLTEENKK